ncbi:MULTISPECIES: dihydroxy-acid dehydratase [Marinomonas]|uniref:Dihydroxy-acid dehydratase n=2 Tax=Marinomonas TaxID=28253 RepID=A0A7H1J7R1_9GAMM|nr:MULTISPECIES: dihydroxy-acid dehydratase [Marinomonas]MCS7487511.1 dihydroxy-acid dehydratase [Marinomonas sp. BSi20414]PYF82362.1 hypothetical protein DFP75_103188 [Marinomonas alcarazii]QNT06527.1 dihydroxy-acid dehydratase [Marinomonas arctica]GGN35710.1 hypothetical protein GCM10011350_33300 [Marinomonas arctica]
MIGHDNQSEIDRYGVAPWIAGGIVATILIVCMFALAAGFA